MTTPTFFYSSQPFLVLGVLLFCAGTLLGIPHGRSKRRADGKQTELWRIAHLSTCVGGIAIITLALAMERIFGDHAFYMLAPFSLAACFFFVACTLSAWLNKAWNGDRLQPYVKSIYRLQILASVLSLAAVGITAGLLAGKVYMLWQTLA